MSSWKEAANTSTLGSDLNNSVQSKSSPSLKAKWMQFKCNMFPCYRRTGARVVFVADDFREVHIKLPLNWKTRGYFGTTFGGSMYGAVDPIYMVMLNLLLGPHYVVWDKAAKIEFKRPGRVTLDAQFLIPESETRAIVEALGQSNKMDRTYYVDLKGPEGKIYAHFEKILHIRRRKVDQE